MNSFPNNNSNFISKIDKIMQSKMLSHAYIIQVGDYEEDFLLVKLFVKEILCSYNKLCNDIFSCNLCNICSLIDSNSYPDLYIVEPDGKEIKKNQLAGLQKDFQNKSLLGQTRVYIIKEADKLNDAAANTILKFLEEPNDNIVAILVTTNRYRMLETILSRCQVLSINSMKKNIVYDNEIIDLVNYICEGESLFINYNDIIDHILPDKVLANERLKTVEEIFVQYLEKKNTELSQYLIKLSSDCIIKYILIIEEYLQKLQYNVNYKLWLDSFFAKLLVVSKNV